MSRTIQDADFLEWEVFASAAESGFADHSQVVFNCLSNRWLRPRAVELEGDVAEAERLVADGSPVELLKIFQTAKPID
jgi:hypothetical protein